MPLKLVQSKSARTLWETCSDRFLDEIGSNCGPSGFGSQIWITNRNLRDLLFEQAFRRGIRRWLGPPISFFSKLPKRFDIRLKAISSFESRALVRQLAVKSGHDTFSNKVDGTARGHMLDRMFGELLPEGIHPERLRSLLSQIEGDGFAEQLNKWIVEVYAKYLDKLERAGVYDPRSIHALIAERIESGRLQTALSGADHLHIYGIHSLEKRERMFSALAAQMDVDVVVYLPKEPEPNEFESLASVVETVSTAGAGAEEEVNAVIQPAPTIVDELGWVAREVKKLLENGKVEPHEIAVIARRGQDDTRRACDVLSAAGLHCTARIRTRLVEIPVLKALLSILRAASLKWSHPLLRAVLDHPYLAIELDLQYIDTVARQGQVGSIGEWEERLAQLVAQLKSQPNARGATSPSAAAAEETLVEFQRFRAVVDKLDTPHTEAEWIRITHQLMRGDVLGLQQRICDPVDDDQWGIVRLDQEGLKQAEILLNEWAGLEHGDCTLDIEAWYSLLSRTLKAEALDVPTKMQKGVQIQEAYDAALVPFRHTFLIHANDGEFPRRAPLGGVFGDEDRIALRKLGLPVSHHEQWARRERSLWRSITFNRDVRISYRTADPKGTALLCSPMIPDHQTTGGIPFGMAMMGGEGSRPRPINSPQANRFAILELAEHLRGESTKSIVTVAPNNAPFLEQAIVAAVAERHRDTGRLPVTKGHPVLTPNPWNGAIRDRLVLDELEAKFGDEYRWSASQLEKYAQCPFAFFVERVLELDEPKVVEHQPSPTRVGRIAHELLARFYKATKGNLPEFLDRGSLEIFDRVTEEVFAQQKETGAWIPALWAIKKGVIRDGVRAYIEAELEDLAKNQEEPHLMEHSFGDDEPLVIQGMNMVDSQVNLRIRGFIDRVDRNLAGGEVVHHVLDYKWKNTPSRNGYMDGSVLQGPIYLRAIQMAGLEPGKCRYRRIILKQPKKISNAAETRIDSDRFERAMTIAFSIPGRVRDGLFEASLAAKVGDWSGYFPGPEICRSQAVLPEGTRFDV